MGYTPRESDKEINILFHIAKANSGGGHEKGTSHKFYLKLAILSNKDSRAVFNLVCGVAVLRAGEGTRKFFSH